MHSCSIFVEQKYFMENKFTLPPEWAEQEALQLTWPHDATDWRSYLDDICATYVEMADAVTRHERLIIVTPEPDAVEAQLKVRLTYSPVNTLFIYKLRLMALSRSAGNLSPHPLKRKSSRRRDVPSVSVMKP